MRTYVEGAIIGFMLALWLANAPWSDAMAYRKALRECERTLPRDQHCIVIGVPNATK
jgi:hypothetical protein